MWKREEESCMVCLPAYNNVNLIAKQHNIAFCITGTYLYYGNYYGLIISIVSKEPSYTIHGYTVYLVTVLL